jgi:hypothetical protein
VFTSSTARFEAHRPSVLFLPKPSGNNGNSWNKAVRLLLPLLQLPSTRESLLFDVTGGRELLTNKFLNLPSPQLQNFFRE